MNEEVQECRSELEWRGGVGRGGIEGERVKEGKWLSGEWMSGEGWTGGVKEWWSEGRKE